MEAEDAEKLIWHAKPAANTVEIAKGIKVEDTEILHLYSTLRG